LAGPLIAGWLGVIAALAGAAMAEDPPRRVGSLNYVSGDVSYVLRAEPGEPTGAEPENWLHADFNQPVCQDMTVRTGAMARARVRIGPDAIQLADDTWLNMLNLTDQLIEVSVPRGQIFLQLTSLDPNESVEFETPRGSLWVLQAGAYDIKIGAGDQPTRIVVFEGKARFVGGAADLPITAGKEAEISGTYPALVTALHDWTGPDPTRPGSSTVAPGKPAAPEADTAPAATAQAVVATDAVEAIAAPGKPAAPTATLPAGASEAANAAVPPASTPAVGGSAPDATSRSAAVQNSQTVVADARQKPADDFLLWVEQSNDDQPRRQQQASPHVSVETTGADALDRYGRWDVLPDSEAVWFPASVPQDWAPYRFGHWDWIEPWGWTWVDDQPWGFAPFHYGRWVNIDGRWGWVPGAVQPHPVYAPALVAFVDTPEAAGSAGPDGGPDAGANGGPEGGPEVGWFPLGPGDDYQPWYQAGPDYVASVNAPEHRHFRDFAGRGYGERGREPWRGGYFNRRYATVVSREAFADARRLDRGMMRQVSADRLEHAAVMRGAPHAMPVAMRVPARPGEFRGAAHSVTSEGMAGGGSRERPGGAADHEAGVAGRGPRQENERAGERQQQGFGRAEPNPGAIRSRAAAAQYEHAGGARGMPEAGHAETRQAGRPQVFQTSAPGFRGGAAQQFGRPEASPGFRGGAAQQQFGRPEASQGFRGGAAQQFGRPQVAPGFAGGAPQQFGRPQVAQGFRAGGQQFGRPQAFQTPAASFRGGAMPVRAMPVRAATPVRAAPQATARPAPHIGGGAGGGARHK
jgi:hypothetical protein